MNSNNNHNRNKFNNKDDDFEVYEMFNPSMQNIRERDSKKLKNNLNTDSESFEAKNDSRNMFFRSQNKGHEKSERMYFFTGGFTFIIMFFISILTIFLIFKTPYYNYYVQEEPEIIESNSSIPTTDPFSLTEEELNEKIIENTDNIPQAQESTSSNNYTNEDEMLVREFNNSTDQQNNEETEITKILKQSAETNESSNVESNQGASQNTNISDLINTEVSNNVQENTSNQETSSETQQIVSNNTTNNLNDITVYSSEDENIWLVSIYSTQNENDLTNILMRLKRNYKEELSGMQFYFVENHLDDITNYRIAVSNYQQGIENPHFNDQSKASSFCNKLKQQGVDCFIIPTKKSLLSRYIVK